MPIIKDSMQDTLALIEEGIMASGNNKRHTDSKEKTKPSDYLLGCLIFILFWGFMVLLASIFPQRVQDAQRI